MNEKAKQARREYHRLWQQANREKVKSYQAAYWERRAAALEEYAARQQDNEEK